MFLHGREKVRSVVDHHPSRPRMDGWRSIKGRGNDTLSSSSLTRSEIVFMVTYGHPLIGHMEYFFKDHHVLTLYTLQRSLPFPSLPFLTGITQWGGRSIKLLIGEDWVSDTSFKSNPSTFLDRMEGVSKWLVLIQVVVACDYDQSPLSTYLIER